MTAYFKGWCLAIALFSGGYFVTEWLGASIPIRQALAVWHSGEEPGVEKQRPLATTARSPAHGMNTAARVSRPGADQPLPVEAAEARLQRFSTTRNGVGSIEPLVTVKVRARVEGEIVERLVEDGAVVSEGEILFRIDDSELRMQVARDEATLARERATLGRLEDDLVRARELWSRNVASQAKVDQIASDVKVSAANVAATEAMLRTAHIKLGYTTVRAPIAGRVGIVRSAKGDVVGPGEGPNGALLTITQMKPLQVSFALPDRDLGLIRAALRDRLRPPHVRLFAQSSDEPIASGTLTFVDSAVDTTSGTILVKAVIPNRDEGLWPGQHVRAEVHLGDGPELVTVPLAAIQSVHPRSWVFVVEPDGIVSRRQVEIVQIGGGRAALHGSLQPGERVVVEGQFRLREGARVTVTRSAEGPLRRAAGHGGAL
jgi:multidrug efflux system membrane fusion protein